MKYPIIKVASLPKQYKHGAKVFALHLNFDKEGSFFDTDKEIKEDYMTSIKNEIAKVVENQFIASNTAVVTFEDEIFILFKDNIDLRLLNAFIKGLLNEVDEYVESKMHNTYCILKIMLMEKGKEAGMFDATKVGLPILESSEYKKNKVSLDSLPKGTKFCYLKSYEDFVQEYANAADMYSI